MRIQVLGSGCPTCKKLYEDTQKVVRELGIDDGVEYINDMAKMIEMGVMTSPVLALDGQVLLSGGGKSEDDIKEALVGKVKNKGEEKGGCGCGCGHGCC